MSDTRKAAADAWMAQVPGRRSAREARREGGSTGLTSERPRRRATQVGPAGPHRSVPSAAPALLSTFDVGGANRTRVLQALADFGPLARADLARIMGVRRSTIGSIVNSLIDAEILEESPEASPAGVGKPPRPLWFGRYAGLSGAVFVRDGVIETAAINARGDILRRAEDVIDAAATRASLEAQVLANARRVLSRYRGKLSGIGVAVPAVCDATGNIIACTPIPELVGTTLPATLGGWALVPVVLEDDVAALALGERWFGQGRGVRDFATVQVGDGIGAAIVLGGRLLRGQHVASMEIGHTCVDPHGDTCRCGLRGCWETVASTRWLRVRAAALKLAGASEMNPGRLVELVEAGDATAEALLDEYADNLAIGLANIVQLFSVDLFILHGDVVQGGQLLLDRVQAAVSRRSLRVLVADARLSFSALERDSGLLGAAATVMTRVLGISV